jgi:imidazolonepropionase-like amidohydrolase
MTRLQALPRGVWRAVLALFVLSGTATAGDFVLKAGGWVTPDGAIAPDAAIVIRDGRIAQVNAAGVGGEVVAFSGGVVSPGLVDVLSQLTAEGQLAEPAEAIQPAAQAAEAFDAHRLALRRALAGGVTAFGLSPGDVNVVGGRIAVCRTAGPAAAAHVLVADGPMKLAIAESVFRSDREPTARSGAIDLLRRTLTSAKAAGDGDPAALLKPMLDGQMTGVCTAPTEADIGAVFSLQQEFALRLAVRHEWDAAQVAPDFKGANLTAIVGPFDLQAHPRRALAPARFEAAGAPVAIAGNLPFGPPDALRISAAVAVRNGLSPAAARRAITAVPADVLGVGDQIGRIAAGARADLVIFSGDPLDLRSRVLAVFLDGQRVSLENGAH